MALKDLKVKKDAPSFDDLCEEKQSRFIYNNGLFNCKILKLKSFNEVMSVMSKYLFNDELTESDIAFIKANENKEVLCHILGADLMDKPDIFVFGDNNIPFQVNCFV